jgi:hypothetical protein
MYRTGFFWRFLLGLLLIGLLAAGGTALFRAGWAQGYQVAAISAASGAEGSVPAPLYYPYMGYGYRPFFGPFGLFGLVGMLFLFFILFGGLFRMWGWRRHAMHGKWEEGHMPPWAREWKERHERHGEEPPKTQGETPGQAGV